MDARIKILPDLVMKRIAAGEVVERPASVVKELLENSLDAGASSISLIVRDAGSGLIKVVDDGCGMSSEDAALCCERHATSKVYTSEDLETISTLGFRGEALASISSVARMEIVTCRQNDSESSRLIYEDGSVVERLKTAPRRGTAISVKDLFYNQPARRKFLKAPSTELRHIISVFRHIAIAFPAVEFELIIDDERTYDLRAADRKQRILDLLSSAQAHTFIPVEKTIGSVSLQGLISRPGSGRKSKQNQLFFLNNRFITDRSLSHAVMTAYGTRLSRNEYPDYFIFLTIDPSRVDVNVHPTKIEVRFLDSRLVYDTVRRAVADGLRTPAVVPELQLVPGKISGARRAAARMRNPEEMGQLTLEAQRQAVGSAPVVDFRSGSRERPPFWQLHDTYILTQIKSSLVLIDQHVAHERILYEKALASLEDKRGISQQLLFPQSVQLDAGEFAVLTDMLPYLNDIGFTVREFGKNTVIVEAVPVTMKNGTEKELLLDMIDMYREESGGSDAVTEKIAAVYACKAAVKAGDPLTLQEMASLVDQLFSTKEPYFCPHGRPIIINLTLEEINKKFGR
ncbi:DNA mismatch repair endonuclease MutL [bacterium]|nr:DNA mismatch repair endonuclease MutL [bacterium]